MRLHRIPAGPPFPPVIAQKLPALARDDLVDARCSAGVWAETAMIGSSSTGEQFAMPSDMPTFAAIWNAASLESTE
jgi:hypothetical protein